MRKTMKLAAAAAALSFTASGCIPQTTPPENYHPAYQDPRPMNANDQVWKDENGNYHCRRKDGTTGLVVGAAIGALFGGVIFGGDIKTLGIIAGAVGGGLVGRSIERGEVKCQ